MNLEQRLDETFDPVIGILWRTGIAQNIPITDEVRDEWERNDESPTVYLGVSLDRVALRPGEIVKQTKWYTLYVHRDYKSNRAANFNVFFNQIAIEPTEELKQLPDKVRSLFGEKDLGDEDVLPDKDVFSDVSDPISELEKLGTQIDHWSYERNDRSLIDIKDYIRRLDHWTGKVNEILYSMNLSSALTRMEVK